MAQSSGSFSGKRRRSPFRHGSLDAVSMRGWKLPQEWIWNSGPVIDYIAWFAISYDLAIPQRVDHAWRRFEVQVDNRQPPVMRSRELRLISYKIDHIDDIKSRIAILNLEKLFPALTTSNRKYDVQPLCGVDFCVQAVLVMQEVTIDVLLAAMEMVERDNLRDLAICCKGATHRSVGCLILLAAMVYPNAEIVLTTKRTQLDAINYGLCGELFAPEYLQQQLIHNTCDIMMHTPEPRTLVKFTRREVEDLQACLKNAYASHKTMMEVLKGVAENVEQDSNMIYC